MTEQGTSCPRCGHKPHGEVCLNMASDNDCACTAGRPQCLNWDATPEGANSDGYWRCGECPACVSERAFPPEVEEALAKARVSMRAKTEQMLADYGLTPEQIVEFMAEIDKAGEELRRKTARKET